MEVSVTAWKFAVTLLGMWRLYRPMREIVARARQIAREQGSSVISEAHLFLAILDLNTGEESTISRLLAATGVSRQEARIYAQSAFENRPVKRPQNPRLTRGAKLALANAIQEADFDNNLSLEARHLFIACARARETRVLLAPIGRMHALHLGDILLSLGLDATRLREHLRGLKRNARPYPSGNPLNDLSPGAKDAIEAAHGAARASFCGKIAPTHLLLGLLGDSQSVKAFENAGCDLDDLKKRARELIATDGETATTQKRFSPVTRQVIERAAREAKRAKRRSIDCEELRLALLPPVAPGNRRPAHGAEKLDELWTPAQLQSLHEARSEAPEIAGSPAREEFSSANAVWFRLSLSVALFAVAGLNGYFVVSWLNTGGLFAKSQFFAVMTALFAPVFIALGAAVFLEGPLCYGLRCVFRVFGGIAAGAAAGWFWSQFF